VAHYLKHAQDGSLRATKLASEFRATAREQDSRAAASGGESSAGASVPPVQPSASLEGNERILIAEDENNTRLLMKAILGYRGYQITEAADGREAWARCEGAVTPFDLVILDIEMPGMDGREVFKRIRERWSDMAVLFLSGNAEDLASLGDEQKRRTKWLDKPFANTQLLQAVRAILDQSRAGIAPGAVETARTR